MSCRANVSFFAPCTRSSPDQYTQTYREACRGLGLEGRMCSAGADKRPGATSNLFPAHDNHFTVKSVSLKGSLTWKKAPCKHVQTSLCETNFHFIKQHLANLSQFPSLWMSVPPTGGGQSHARPAHRDDRDGAQPHPGHKSNEIEMSRVRVPLKPTPHLLLLLPPRRNFESFLTRCANTRSFLLQTRQCASVPLTPQTLPLTPRCSAHTSRGQHRSGGVR